MGNMLADIMKHEMESDIAFINAGSIRSDDTYGPGRVGREGVSRERMRWREGEGEGEGEGVFLLTFECRRLHTEIAAECSPIHQLYR